VKRIVISDVHIGSKYYKGKELISFLQNTEYDQLILAGDIIDFIRVPTFTSRALEIAKSIDYSKDIIYIVGNHDSPLQGFVGMEAFGIKFRSKYEFEEGGRKFRVEHGDSYDDTSFLHNNIIMAFLSVSQSCIEHWFDLNLSDLFTTWKMKKRKLRRIWDILKRNEDVDVLITGHSHMPEAIVWINEKEVIKSYINSGDWVTNASFVVIEDGEARLKTHFEGPDDWSGKNL
jgi:UDP-2,3-diacylglucosamine pyrophosphatase LpxH